jgi:predicted nucleotidyltransferase
MWSRSFDPRAAARRGVAAAERVLGGKLLGATLYGSVATGEFHASVSDVNVAFVLSSLGAEELEALRGVRGTWTRDRILRPLLLSERSLSRSLDTFPLEYLLIRERHEPLAGRDYFADLAVERGNLRLQVERVLRAQELGLSLAYLALADTRAGARHWAERAGAAMAASAAGLLWLKEGAVPATRRALAERCGEAFGVDRRTFTGILLLRSEPRHPVEPRTLLESTLHVLNRLLETADGLDAPRG